MILVMDGDARCAQHLQCHVDVGFALEVGNVEKRIFRGAGQGHEESGQKLTGQAAVDRGLTAAQGAVQPDGWAAIVELCSGAQRSKGIGHRLHGAGFQGSARHQGEWG